MRTIRLQVHDLRKIHTHVAVLPKNKPKNFTIVDSCLIVQLLDKLNHLFERKLPLPVIQILSTKNVSKTLMKIITLDFLVSYIKAID